jgi:pimeloyl-ACP methyl ester carboxylesterase
MEFHLDELIAAVTALVALPDVDAARIVGLGNSEGTLHVLHYATSPQAVPFVGVVLLAPPGRSVGTLLLSQLGAQAALLPDGEHLMTMVRAAAARYEAGQPMDPDPLLPDSVKMLLASFETPANLPFARELWSEDATDALARLRVPGLVVIGGRDIQVDATADGTPLQAAGAATPDVTFAFPPNANHVVKEELRPAAEVAAAPGSGYNEDGTRLDPEAVDVILGWLRRVLDPGPEA